MVPRYYDQALVILEKSLGRAHPDLGQALNDHGEYFLMRGQYRQAVVVLERAQTIFAQNTVEPSLHAQTKFLLARALWRAKRDRKRKVRAGGVTHQRGPRCLGLPRSV